MTTIETLKQALEAFGRCEYYVVHEVDDAQWLYDVQANLRKAIEEMENQEPACFVETDDDGDIAWGLDVCMSDDPSWFDNPKVS